LTADTEGERRRIVNANSVRRVREGIEQRELREGTRCGKSCRMKEEKERETAFG